MILLGFTPGQKFGIVGFRNQNNPAIIHHLILSLLLLVAGLSLTTAGQLKGKVNVEADAIMVTVQDVQGTFSAPPDSHSVINQRNMRFDPILLPIVVGTTVDFPNSETVIYHNVFSLSAPKVFELGTYRKGETRSVTFGETGIVEIFCSIHVRMYAVVPVLDNPYFSIVDEDGKFEINNIPSGNYTIKVILVYAKKQEYREIYREVFIPQHGEAVVIFKEKMP